MTGPNGADAEPSGSSPPRGLRPRVVLALLLVAALAGAWIAHRGQPLTAKLLPWAITVTTGAVAGGTYWRLVLFDGDAFDRAETRQVVQERWQRIETALVWGTGISGAAYLVTGPPGPVPEFGRSALGIGTLAVVVCWYGAHRYAGVATDGRTTALRAGILAGAGVSIAGFAWLETGTTALDWSVRVGHLTALAFWLGGAVWHNFVVLPTLRTRPSAAPAVKSQAHGFRSHLPVVIAVLFATGVYQVGGLIGYSVTALTRTTVGHVVVGKVAVLTLLTGLVAFTVRKSA